MNSLSKYYLFFLFLGVLGFQFDNLIFGFSLVLFVLFGALRFKDDPVAFPVLFFVFFCVYSFVFGRFVIGDFAIINNIIDSKYDRVSIVVLYLYFAIFYFIFSFGFVVINQCDFYNNIPVQLNKKSVRLYSIFSIFLFLLGIIIQFASSGGMSAIEGRAGYSPLYEYAIVPYLFSIYFSRGSYKIVRLLIISGLFFAILRDFSLGHRVTGLQIGLLVYLFYMTNFYSFRRFLVGFCFLIVVIAMVAVIRGGSGIGIFALLVNLISNGLAFDTAYYAYVASLTFMAVHDIHSISQIFDNFMGFLLLLFFGSGSAMDLYTITKQYYQHSNGGVLPFYFYYYLGWFGVVFSALISGSFFRSRSLFQRKSGLGYFSSVIFAYYFCTLPRWFLYSPQPLIRGMIITFLLSLVVYIVARFFNVKVNSLHL